MSGYRCGTVALVGRPNTGKSSLLNRLAGAKLAVVSSKAQTTRHAVRGVVTAGGCQMIVLDLPGYQLRHGGALNRALNRRAAEGARQCDVAALVVEAPRFGEADRTVLAGVPASIPAVAVVNKVDLAGSAAELLPFLERLGRERDFAAIVPVSARTGRNLAELERVLHGLLPEAPPAYPPGQLTDRNERFLAAELLREKLFRFLGEDLPYRCDVTLESFREERRGGRVALRRIEAVIWVERESQKAIAVGRAGEMLKRVSSAARKDMEQLFGGKVYLGAWVKVKRDWTRDRRLLRQLGYA